MSPDWLCQKMKYTILRRLGEVATSKEEWEPRPVFTSSYTLAFSLHLRKNHGKPQGIRKVTALLVPIAIRLVDWVVLCRWPWLACWHQPFLAFASGDTVNHQSANSRTPRFLLIFLLLRYKGAPVTKRRHLDCSTCRLLNWVRATDLQEGHA
jgi:hypothetical protein